MIQHEGQRGQALPLVVLFGATILLAGVGVFWFGHGHAAKAHAQTAADLTAISAARRLRELLPAIVAPPPRRNRTWRGDVGSVAHRVAIGNGVRLVRLGWPDAERWPPTSVEVVVSVPGPVGTTVVAAARAQVMPGTGALPESWSAVGGGQYAGPLLTRDGKPMCPAVAQAFDRMDAAAHAAGVDLVVTSGFRSDAEQAVLFRRHPDPTWVAPPGKSRHRHATELDIAGTSGAWAWLADHAPAFGFVQRYSWEPWHYGYVSGCGDEVPDTGGDVAVELPGWVPVEYRSLVVEGATAGGVPPIVLAALLEAESGFDRWAVSPVGAQGIAQFMPTTARSVGLRDPFDPARAIPAAGRLLGGHLRAFGSIPLALAAYNAGSGAVRRYGGIPPYAETRAYVARIMALAGDPTVSGPLDADRDGVELVRIDDMV